jgi:antirestriction protein ArdC
MTMVSRRRRRDGDDPLARAHEQLTAAVQALVDGDAWQRMLQVAARFPRYSPNNVLLITVQRPDATAVAGLRTWNSLGRRVRRGEKGIAILAPCTYRADSSAVDAFTDGRADRVEQTAESDHRVLRGFRVAHVFDIMQTEGTPLPDLAPEALTGSAPTDLWRRLVKLVEHDGYRVERGPCGGAYGLTMFTDKVVRVRQDVEPAQATKTLAHEIGHIRADHQTRFTDYHRSAVCRGSAEVEAESIAYIVGSAAGMDTTRYTVPYIAHWANGNKGLLRDTATRVLATARQILTDTGTLPTDPATLAPSRWRSPDSLDLTATAKLSHGPAR